MAKDKITPKSKKEDIWLEKSRLENEVDRLVKEVNLYRDQKESIEMQFESLKASTNIINELRQNLGYMVEKMDMLNRLSKEINSINLDKIINVAITKVPFLANATLASLYFYEPNTGELILKKKNHAYSIDEVVSLEKNSDSLMAETIRRKNVVILPSITQYEESSERKFSRPNSDKYNTDSCVIIPLFTRGEIIGVLNFADKSDGTYFDEVNDLPPLKQITEILATSMENCRLFEVVQERSKTDSMTGLYNHSTFYEEMEREVRRAGRYERTVSVLVFDLDDFKYYNDTFGHQAGDYILEDIARIIRKSIRTSDFAARYGGDEFSIILPETPLTGAASAARRIMNAVRENDWTFQGTNLDVNISMGIASFENGQSAAELVRNADQALLQAKRMGKNRIVQAEPGEEERYSVINGD